MIWTMPFNICDVKSSASEFKPLSIQEKKGGGGGERETDKLFQFEL